MPRTARASVGGVCYHVLNRGNNRMEVFHSSADYARFVALMAEAQSRVELDIFAACLMPNHFHLLVRPRADEDLSMWMQWLLTSHVRQYHRQYRGSGRVWQGRFKAFPVQEDSHLLTVMRYVERNALTANMVERAEDWSWGSLNWRARSDTAIKLTAPPIAMPSNWSEYVNGVQTPRELEHLRSCVHRQRPFGDRGWVELTARKLGLTSSLRSVGRPRSDNETVERYA
jgi:putative transposase